MSALITETIVDHHGEMQAEYRIWRAGTIRQWRCMVTIRGVDHGIRVIPVELGLAGWSTAGALMPFKARSWDSVLRRAREAAAESPWLRGEPW